MADTFDPINNQMILDKEIAARAKELEKDPYDDLAKQCRAEWQLAYDHQSPKKEEALLRLKLYNNQRRDKDAAGDVTMFTTHQTLLASFYVDQLGVTFTGREEGDEETGETLTNMAEFDYDEMEKDVTDFDWLWDTLAFGRGLLDMTAFIRDPANGIFVPCPEVIDPTTFLRDPRAVSVNGNNKEGKNGARFFGRDIRMGRDAMEKNIHFLKTLDWKDIKFGNSTNSLLEEAAQARASAQGYNYDQRRNESKLGANAEYDITEWSTNWKLTNGEIHKAKVWLANQRKKVVGFMDLGKPEDRWGLIDRPLYPTSHDWDGTSVFDLTEDKQRLRAVATNLGIKSMMADLYPMYTFDSNKVKNRGELKYGFNKFIPVDGDPNSIQPMRKFAPNMQLLEYIMQTLQTSAQIANATSDFQEGILPSRQVPVSEMNIIANKIDVRYSLSTKIFGWSEKRFWQRYYWMYKEYFKDGIDKKTIRIDGAFGTKWRGLTKENFIGNTDPDIKIESRTLSRAHQLEERQSLTSYLVLAFQDPTANRRYGLKKLGKSFGMPTDEINRLLPPTIDEMQATDENDLLNDNKPVQVFAAQNHNVHLEIHNKAKDTVAKGHHIETHKKALMLKVTNPELFPTAQDQTAAAFTTPGTAPAVPQAVGMGTPAKAPGVASQPSSPTGITPVTNSQTSGQITPTPGK